jgi:hypothetical protein
VTTVTVNGRAATSLADVGSSHVSYVDPASGGVDACLSHSILCGYAASDPPATSAGVDAGDEAQVPWHRDL